MPRRPVSAINADCCYHITQRCQERRYLLRFKRDRRQYLVRLRQAVARYPISILNYMPTSNHVHLLVRCPSGEDLSAAMQFISGSTAQDYNRRKKRQGAFWAGRYRATLIQPGHHFNRCFFYISLNMVRAHAVTHPAEWVGGSHAELIGDLPFPDRIIDQDELRRCLECHSGADFRGWYLRTLADACNRPAERKRQSYWTEAAAVGDCEWISRLADLLPQSWSRVTQVSPETDACTDVAESPGTYTLSVSRRRRESLIVRFSR